MINQIKCQCASAERDRWRYYLKGLINFIIYGQFCHLTLGCFPTFTPEEHKID